MLLRHVVTYAVARGLPAIVSLLAIAVYTRMLSTEAYGHYALVIAAVGFAQTVFYWWLRLALLRFLPEHQGDPGQTLSTIFAGFGAMTLLSGVVGLMSVTLWQDPTVRTLGLLAIALLWTQAWCELNLELARSRLAPIRYGIGNALRVVIALGVGVGLIQVGFGAYGPLIGLIIGMGVAGALLARRQWGKLDLPTFDSVRLWAVAKYGLPLALSFSLGFVVAASDRFIIGALIGAENTGVYAAGYDLAQQPLALVMGTIYMAAYPLIVKALEQEGREAAIASLRKNLTLLLLVSVPLVLGLMTFSHPIARLMLGETFAEAGGMVMPWIALVGMLEGLKSFHFDLAFHLSKKTVLQIWINGTIAALNVALNLWWIPLFGYMGAAYATVTAYAAGMASSAWLGRRAFEVPLFPYDQGKLFSVALLFAGGLYVLQRTQVGPGLAICAAAVVYVFLLYGLDVLALRARIAESTRSALKSRVALVKRRSP